MEGPPSGGDSPPNNPPRGSAVLRMPAVGGAAGFVGGGARVVGGGILQFMKKSLLLEATTAKGTTSIGAQEHDNNDHDDYWLCLRRPRLPALDAAATAATASPLTTAKGSTASIGAQEHDNDDHNNYWSCLRRPRLPASDAAATAATAPPLSCRSQRRATTMPMHMTAAMKTRFIEYANKKKQDFVTVRQKQKETKESDLNFPEEWAFPTPHGICTPAMFNCTEIPGSLKIRDRVYACLHGPKGDGRGWHLARVWGILEDGRYEVAFDSGETDNLHPIQVCIEDEYETNMNRLVAMFHSYTEREKREKEAAAAHAQQSKPAARQQRTSRMKTRSRSR